MNTRRPGIVLFYVALLWSLGTAFSSTIVFVDGKVANDVTILAQTETHVQVQMSAGKVNFPKNIIKSVDGKPLNGVAPAATGLSEPAPVQNPAPVAPVSTPVPVIPASPPVPATSVEPVATPTAVAPEVPAATPAAVVAPTPTPPPAPTYEHTWNFEYLLLGLLIFGGIWMRSLQWVQHDLFERRADPRFWTSIALVLPGVGALAYAIVARVGDSVQRRQFAKANPTQTQSTQAAGGQKFPWMMPLPDPAAHLAAKGNTRKGFEFLDTERKSVQTKAKGEPNTGLDHAAEMLEEALLARASDVHIEPTAHDYRVRFRLDGIMHERMTYESDDGRRVVTSLKTLAEIDVAEKRKAQDGRFRVRCAGREVDFRVATANSIHGEKMVIRILDHQSGIFDLTSLGMSDEMLATFQSVVHSRNGMILATGPTGAGKTSTLYAALRQLDATRLNIMTIEDPPEYELAGATQLAVNPKAGITYESGLRSILRQDPDVILVGEMRDTEAGQVALRAALTGHLVLSSLHTKNAVGTISRLQDMGIERYQVASGLLMVIAQRLVRVLCPECRTSYPAEGNELASLGFSFEAGTPLYASKGCDHCLGTGFKGRTGLFELLVMDDDLRRAVGEGMDEAGVEAMVVERGFRSYRYDGAEKILMGVTTVEEVLQAV